jgi:hypothetical protein
MLGRLASTLYATTRSLSSSCSRCILYSGTVHIAQWPARTSKFTCSIIPGRTYGLGWFNVIPCPSTFLLQSYPYLSRPPSIAYAVCSPTVVVTMPILNAIRRRPNYTFGEVMQRGAHRATHTIQQVTRP